MTDELELTEQTPGADPELTKAANFAILKASELLSHFGIEVTELRIQCRNPAKLLHTYQNWERPETMQ